MTNISTIDFILVIVACFTTQICFSGYSIVLKKFAQDEKVDPLVFSTLRDVITFPVLLFASVIIDKCSLSMPTKREVPFLALLGLTGIYGNQLLFIMGLYFTTPSNAAVFQPLIPILTCALALIFKLETLGLNRLSVLKMFGILAAAGGAVTLLLMRSNTSSNESQQMSTELTWSFLLGDLFLFGNCLSMAVYMLIQKRSGLTTLRTTAWSYGFGAVFMLLSNVYHVVRGDYDKFKVSLKILIPLIYAVLVSSSLCYALITFANARVSSTLVTAFWPLQSAATIVLAAIFLAQPPQLSDVLGGALIGLGLLCVCYAKYYEEKRVLGDKEHLLDTSDNDDEQSINKSL